jgi:hypothetical protein
METNQASSLIGVVLGRARTAGEAAAVAGRFSRCPYCATFAATGRNTMGVFTLPADQKWWLTRLADDLTSRLGLESAEVLETKALDVSSPWSRGEVKPNSHPAPCGTDCRKCSQYRGECKGCPATMEYVGN